MPSMPITDLLNTNKRVVAIKTSPWHGGGGVILGHPVCSIPSGILSYTVGNEQEMLVEGVCS